GRHRRPRRIARPRWAEGPHCTTRRSRIQAPGRRLEARKSPLLSLPGAVPAEGADEGVAAHYGDLFREQRALADGTGFVDLSHRGVVTVSGDDRLGWLHLLLTQHVSELP